MRPVEIRYYDRKGALKTLTQHEFKKYLGSTEPGRMEMIVAQTGKSTYFGKIGNSVKACLTLTLIKRV